MKRATLAIVLSILFSCAEQKNAVNPIGKEKFGEIYIELLDSSSTIHSSPDSIISPVAERILMRHSVTAEQFRSTIKEFHADTEQWKEFYQSISKRMDERIAKRQTNPRQ